MYKGPDLAANTGDTDHVCTSSFSSCVAVRRGRRSVHWLRRSRVRRCRAEGRSRCRQQWCRSAMASETITTPYPPTVKWPSSILIKASVSPTRSTTPRRSVPSRNRPGSIPSAPSAGGGSRGRPVQTSTRRPVPRLAAPRRTRRSSRRRCDRAAPARRSVPTSRRWPADMVKTPWPIRDSATPPTPRPWSNSLASILTTTMPK